MNETEIYNLLLTQLSKLFKCKADSKKLSIRKLAGISGVANTTICDLFQNKYLPKIESIIKLSLALDVQISEIVGILKAVDVDNTGAGVNKIDEIEAILSAKGLSRQDVAEIMNFIRFRQNRKTLEVVEKLSKKYHHEGISTDKISKLIGKFIESKDRQGKE